MQDLISVLNTRESVIKFVQTNDPREIASAAKHYLYQNDFYQQLKRNKSLKENFIFLLSYMFMKNTATNRYHEDFESGRLAPLSDSKFHERITKLVDEPDESNSTIPS